VEQFERLHKDVQYFLRLINLELKKSGTLCGMGIYGFFSQPELLGPNGLKSDRPILSRGPDRSDNLGNPHYTHVARLPTTGGGKTTMTLKL